MANSPTRVPGTVTQWPTPQQKSTWGARGSVATCTPCKGSRQLRARAISLAPLFKNKKTKKYAAHPGPALRLNDAQLPSLEALENRPRSLPEVATNCATTAQVVDDGLK